MQRLVFQVMRDAQAAQSMITVREARVLVVDDDPMIRSAIESDLVLTGYEVILASNGAAALNLLANYNVHVVLLDLDMPGMSGIETLHAIRELDSITQVIILTGQATLESAIEALRKGAYDFLLKPDAMLNLQPIVRHAAEYANLLRDKQLADAALSRRTSELTETLDLVRDTQERLSRTGNAALMGQLAEGLRHELGNALTVIRLNMNLITHYRLEPERFNRHMTSLEHGVEAIERITLALRDFPTQETRLGEALNLSNLIREAVRQVQQAHPQKQVSFSLNLIEDAFTRGAQLQLLHALGNILENAVEAGDSVDIALIAQPLEGQPFWCLIIRDNGPGFTPEALQHALEPGFTHKIDNGFMRGLGLGLFVASHVIENHNGVLQLANHPQQGAMVKVYLPMEE